MNDDKLNTTATPTSQGVNWQKLGGVAKRVVRKSRWPELLRNKARFRYLVNHIHSLGPRSVGEFISEISLRYGNPRCDDGIMEHLEDYCEFDKEFMKRNGIDVWPGISEAGDGE